MKFFIASTLLLLFIVQSTFAQESQEWEDISLLGYGQDLFISSLESVGVNYVKQKGVFESTKSPFPAKNYIVDDIHKFERRNTSQVTYYRWTVILTEQYNSSNERGPSAARAIFTVSHRPSNDNFIVTDYRYTFYSNGLPAAVENEGEEFENDQEDIGNDVPNIYDYTLLDLRLLNNGTSNFSTVLSDAVDLVVANATGEGEIPDSEYTVKYVYGAETQEDPFDEEYNIVWFLLKLSNSEGDNFLIETRVSYEQQEGGDIVLEEDASPNYSVNIGYLEN